MEHSKAPGMSPCYKCEDREPACHDRCEKYKEWASLHRIAKGRNVDRNYEYFGYMAIKTLKKEKREKGRG